MGLIVLGIIKIIDNIIATWKNISIAQNKIILSAVLVTISQFLFYIVVKQTVSDSSVYSIIVVSVCSGIGTLFACLINFKLKKDEMYVNIITSASKEDIAELSNYLRKEKIKHVVNDSYTINWEKTFSVVVFAKSKFESKIIDDFLEATETKYLREIMK